MASVLEGAERSQQAHPDKSGNPTFIWDTTLTSMMDTVKLIVPPNNVLPVVFVPGIMGSNLCSDTGTPVWVLNSTLGEPIGLAVKWATKSPGERQKILHPDRTRVYTRGQVPKMRCGTINETAEFVTRGWGEVGETSYHAFLVWLEKKLNAEGFDPASWRDFVHDAVLSSPAVPPIGAVKLHPGTEMRMNGLPSIAEKHQRPQHITSDELLRRSKYRFPVYACGYNWLASNKMAASGLQTRIRKIIDENNKGYFRCKQVILVTHSMGGLVARACAQLPGMEERIAGIVHGVMPSVGAAVAYRRCKIGMRDEDIKAGLVIGSTGQEVTAVFSQAPGALQLLPSGDYGQFWLQFKDEHGKTIERLPARDPYTEIYLRKDRWWGLVREEWLDPEGGLPIDWETFVDNVNLARDFHASLSGKFHPRTFVFYGAGGGEQASFETVRWKMTRGYRSAKCADTSAFENINLSHSQVREDGTNNIHVGGERRLSGSAGNAGYGASVVSATETSFWVIQCEKQDGCGDGTVPASSGMHPRGSGGSNIMEQFRLTGFSHEPAFRDATAQTVTHYAITKIAASAVVP